ncbi:MAG TPA: biotin/lipoyl-containing protein [Polyangiaceae bacterium]|jgi:biotin carboxyl carrier protein|nr:biotin/lipoyl-containing protein [Polyangiaceae bacterium]
MKYFVTIGAQTLELDVERQADGSYAVHDADATPLVVRSFSSTEQPGLVSLLVDGQTVEAQPADGEVRFQQERFAVRAESWRDRNATLSAPADATQARKILASMPGRIVRVLCEPGSVVQQGAPLVVIEAMKMQNELCAKATAVVRAVHVTAGQTVERGAVLIELE